MAKHAKIKSIEDAVGVLAEYEAIEADAKARIKEARDYITEFLGTYRSNTVEVIAPGEKAVCRLTISHPTTTHLDEHALRQSISKRAWEQITVRTLDPNLLESAVLRGDIPAPLVGQCTTVEERSPRLTRTWRSLTTSQ